MPGRNGRKNIPEILVTAEIESYSDDGRGLTRLDGRVIIVDGGLPGERVEMVYTGLKRDFAEAKVIRVLRSSPLRSDPKCEYFGICSGCSFQHVDPERQIEVKQQILEQQFRRIPHLNNITFWPPIRGPLWAYRHKARLSVKYVAKKQRALVGFREKATHFVADIGHCEVLHPSVGNKLTEIADLVNSLSIRERIPQIEVAVGDSGCCVLVFRNLSEASADDLLRLRDFGRNHDFAIYLQPKGPDSLCCVDECESRTLSYDLPGHDVKLTFEALQFTQVNVDLNRFMVDRVIQLLDPRPDGRVIDLYCGIGNFTLPISRYSKRTVGVDGSRELIAQAKKNAAINRLENVRFYVADLNTELDHEDWCRNSYTSALLDPSRAGAEAILKYFPRWGLRRIVYISCNSATLARDSAILTRDFGYRIQGAGVIDMFPQTSHIESIVLFEMD